MSWMSERLVNNEFVASAQTVGLLDLPFIRARTDSTGRSHWCAGGEPNLGSSIIKSNACAGPSQIADLAADRPFKCRLQRNANTGKYQLACKSNTVMF